MSDDDPNRPRCKDCGKKFLNPDLLTEHATAHTGEKPFKCMHCKIGFAKKLHLDEHIKAHFVSRRDTCKVCRQRFYRDVLIVPYARTYFGKSIFVGDEPFVCPNCGKKLAK